MSPRMQSWRFEAGLFMCCSIKSSGAGMTRRVPYSCEICSLARSVDVEGNVPLAVPLSARLTVSRAVDAYGNRPSFWSDAGACRT